MNTNEMQLKTYTQILKYRKVFKDFQQYSWNVAKIESNYPIDELTEEQGQALLDFYTDTLSDALDHFMPKLMELRADNLPETPKKGGSYEK